MRGAIRLLRDWWRRVSTGLCVYRVVNITGVNRMVQVSGAMYPILVQPGETIEIWYFPLRP